MAITVDDLEHFSDGSQRRVTGKLVFDNSYDAGGDELLPATIGLQKIDMLWVGFTAGFGFEWVKADNKVKAYQSPDPAGSGGADAALVEVGTADLDGIEPLFVAWGV